jgi:hypothetical protein
VRGKFKKRSHVGFNYPLTNLWNYPIFTGNFSAASLVSINVMMTFLVWCLLLVVCWPLALLALVLYPIVWLLLLPFRIVGITVSGVLELLRAIIFLPARLLGGRARGRA